MPRVIVNSTPSVLLSSINQLGLLEKLYGEVIIPDAVFEEVTAKEDSASSIIRGNPVWLRVEKAPSLPHQYRRLISTKLHAGELEPTPSF